jgi:hypothetical protein
VKPTGTGEIARRDFFWGAVMLAGGAFGRRAIAEAWNGPIGAEWFAARKLIRSGGIGRVRWAQGDVADPASAGSTPFNSKPAVELLASLMWAADVSHPRTATLYSGAGVWVAKWVFAESVVVTLNSSASNAEGVKAVICGTKATLHVGRRLLWVISDHEVPPRFSGGTGAGECVRLPVDSERARHAHPDDRIDSACCTRRAGAAMRLLATSARGRRYPA